jgi:hypothetical protein
MKTFLQFVAALSRRDPPAPPPREAMAREGWPPLSDAPQRRRRSTDARRWDDVRPADPTGFDRRRPL